MTLLEYDRFIASRKRVLEAENRQKASFDYIMADLIGKSIARLYSKDAKYPEIYEAYPIIFNKEEIEAKRKEQALEKSVAQFTQFTKSFNKNFKKEAK